MLRYIIRRILYAVPILFGDLVVLDATTGSVISRVNIGQIAVNLGVSPDERFAYVSGVEDPNDPVITISIVDLQSGTKAGNLVGFELPADLDFASAKPALLARARAALALR